MDIPAGLQRTGNAVIPEDPVRAIAFERKAAPGGGTVRLETLWARHEDEVRAAQGLRWRVFAQELGARLTPPAGTSLGLDIDLFDDYCEHLLVRTIETAEAPARVVGTCRVLTPGAARVIGGLHCDGEFDLVRLHRLRPRIAELGRACTDPAWRGTPVVLMQWAVLAEFMARLRLDIVIGCASLAMRDGGHAAASLWHALKGSHLVPIDRQVRPRLPLPVDRLRGNLYAEPPLPIKACLRFGGKLLGAPAWNPDCGTAALPMMLEPADMPAACRRRFIRA